MVLVGSTGELKITTEDVDSPDLLEEGVGVGEAVATREAMGEVEEGTAVEKELVKPTVVVEGAMPACSETVTEILLSIIR